MHFREQVQSHPWRLAFGFSIIWGVFSSWVFSQLTFFWDEWNVLRDTLRDPVGSILIENGGNFFPLSRSLFSAEVLVFGAWYPGYTFVTSFLFAFAAFILVFFVLQPRDALEFLLAMALALIYLTSAGVAFSSSMGFMNLWPLSVLFAVLAGIWLAHSRGSKRGLSLAALGLTLSWLSHGTAILSASAIFISVVLVAWTRSAPRRIRSHTIVLFLVIPVAILAGLVATQLARLGTSSSSTASPQAFSFNRSTSTIAIEWLSGSASTLVSSASFLPLPNYSLFTRVFIGFVSVPILAILTLTGFVLLAYFIGKPGRRKTLLIFGLLLLSVGFLATVRTPLIVRYEVLWVPLGLLLLWQVLDSVPKGAFQRILVSGYAVFGLVVAMFGISQLQVNANLERPRSDVNVHALFNTKTCMIEAIPNREAISPSLTPSEICQVAFAVDSRNGD